MLDQQDIKLTKNLKRIPPNGGVFLPFGTHYFIKKLPRPNPTSAGQRGSIPSVACSCLLSLLCILEFV